MTIPHPDSKDLRRRAEKKLEAQSLVEDLTPLEAARIIHELQVHQMELELQNEDLRLSQVQLEESRSKYTDLYDFAPVAYLTLDAADKILEANLTAATLLGVERSRLLNRIFPYFLVQADRRIFRQLMNEGMDHGKQRGEVRLKDGNGTLRVLLLDILFLPDSAVGEQRRIAMTDITERQQLTEALRKSEERLRSLASQLLTAQETERRRLAGELHDDLGQTLLFLRMQLSAILRRSPPEAEVRQDLEEAAACLLGIINNVRRLSHDLSPPALERLGLSVALQELLEEFRKYHVQEMTIIADLEDIQDIAPAEADIVIYRITQEFLANVHKHAGATQVSVAIKVWPEKISVDLEDNGRGFDLEEVKKRPGERRGLGLASMEERLRMLGGRFSLVSQPGKGASLHFEIPRTP